MRTRTHRASSWTTAMLVLFLACQSHTLLGTDAWDLNAIETNNSDGKITIRGSSDKNLRIEDPEIKIVDDAQLPGKKVLSFSGTQAKPLGSTKIYEGATSASVHLKIKPAADSDEQAQTVLFRPGEYELRYDTKRQELEALITYKDKTLPVTVRAPLIADNWNEVDLTVKGSDVVLKVDGKTFTEKLPGGGTMVSARSYLRIGRTDQSRPFKGLLADISVSEPAE